MIELPTIIKNPIAPIDLVKYSGASGDFNEIHTVPAVAQDQGLTGIIVHGMFVMGWAAAAIEEWFPNRQLKSFSVRFQAVTHTETVLVITGNLLAGNEGEILVEDREGHPKLVGTFVLQKKIL